MPNYFPDEFLQKIKELEAQFHALLPEHKEFKVGEPLPKLKEKQPEDKESVAYKEYKDAEAVRKMYRIINHFLHHKENGILKCHGMGDLTGGITTAKAFGTALQTLHQTIHGDTLPVYGKNSLAAIGHLKDFLIYLDPLAKIGFADNKLPPSDNILQITFSWLPRARQLKRLPKGLADEKQILEYLHTSLYSIEVRLIKETEAYKTVCSTLEEVLKKPIDEMKAWMASQKATEKELEDARKALSQPDSKDSKQVLEQVAQLQLKIVELTKKQHDLMTAYAELNEDRDISVNLKKIADHVGANLACQSSQEINRSIKTTTLFAPEEYPDRWREYDHDISQLAIKVYNLRHLENQILETIKNSSLKAQWLQIQANQEKDIKPEVVAQSSSGVDSEVKAENKAEDNKAEDNKAQVEEKVEDPQALDLKHTSQPQISYSESIDRLLLEVNDEWISHDIKADTNQVSHLKVDSNNDFKLSENLALVNKLLHALDGIYCVISESIGKTLDYDLTAIVDLLNKHEQGYQTALGDECYKQIKTLVKVKNKANNQGKIQKCVTLISDIVKNSYAAEIQSIAEDYVARVQTIEQGYIAQRQVIEADYKKWENQIGEISTQLDGSETIVRLNTDDDKEAVLKALEINLSDCLEKYKQLKHEYSTRCNTNLQILQQQKIKLENQLSSVNKCDLSTIISRSLSNEIYKKKLNITLVSLKQPNIAQHLKKLNDRIRLENENIVKLRQNIAKAKAEAIEAAKVAAEDAKLQQEAKAESLKDCINAFNEIETRIDRFVTENPADEKSLKILRNDFSDIRRHYLIEINKDENTNLLNVQERILAKFKHANNICDFYRELSCKDFDVNNLALITNERVSADFLLKMLKYIGNLPENQIDLYTKKQRAITVVKNLVEKMTIIELLNFLEKLDQEKNTPAYCYIRQERYWRKFFGMPYGNTQTWHEIVTAAQSQIKFLNTPDSLNAGKEVERIPDDLEATYNDVMCIKSAHTLTCYGFTQLFASPPRRNYILDHSEAGREFKQRNHEPR